MYIEKIFCLGDGFAHGHIWPEWPQILQALLPTHEIITGTGIGAGNEFLIDLLLQMDCKKQTVIFQWARAQRFDKLLQDDDWHERAKRDPVYFFNFETNATGTWWLSSASRDEKVQEYHNLFVQNKQAESRYKNQQTLVENYLQNQNCRYWFTSTSEQESFCQTHAESHLRGKEFQPHPLLHYYFIIERIMPALNLPIASKAQTEMLTVIRNTKWEPYDPDRKEIWQNICAHMKNL
jgi:hypothetical protein